MLPFTPEQFFAVFAAYNQAIWPAQIVAYGLGLIAVGAIFRPGPAAGRAATVVLAGMWLWTGIAYHGLFFAPINKAAFGFGALFVVQGVAIAIAGLARNGLRFGFGSSPAAWLGWIFILYAAVAYPLLGMATGHAYPAMPMFGVTPCPVTIFTFGMLLLTTKPFSRWLLVIPFLWSLIGGSAAILLGMPQDWVLLVSGIVAVPLILLRDRETNSALQAD